MASLVDPRFKTLYKKEKIDTVKVQAMTEMLEEGGATEAGVEGGAAAAAPTPTSAKKQKKTLGSIFKKSYTSNTSAQNSRLLKLN